MMRRSMLGWMLGVACLNACGDFVETELARAVLPAGAAETSFTTVFKAVEAADAAADEAWRNLSGRDAYDAHRRALRAQYVAALGGFPARTPLRPRVTGSEARDGYRVEKILFESEPGVYVTAFLYLPDAARFAPPYPTFVVTCGHSDLGKACTDYGRVCVQGVARGFAALIYDPILQGERAQVPNTKNCAGHNRYGTLAMLLGRSTARQRIWDGLRCLDYLDTRADIRHDGYGYMGNSGGGTMTALIMALDPRVKAAAPCCYLSSIREVAAHEGPQDAEQNVFGQLAFGLNHAGLVLLGDNAVRMHCCHGDFFPFEGSRETYRTVCATAARCGLDATRYGMTDVPGPHGWKESTRTSSVLWMERWLKGNAAAWPIDVAACRDLDVGYDAKAVDCGLVGKGPRVTEAGDITQVAGFRSIYAVLQDALARVEKARAGKSAAAMRAAAVARAGIRPYGSLGVVAKEVRRVETNGVTVTAHVFSFPDGLRVPMQVFTPTGGARGVTLVVSAEGRRACAAAVRAECAAGRTVAVADLLGCGEIVKLRHRFYGAPAADEELAVMLYWLARSLVGVRAEEINVLADHLVRTRGGAVRLRAEGRLAIPAAHARAAAPVLFADLACPEPPPAWADSVRAAGVVRYAEAVQGALLDYDWVDLCR